METTAESNTPEPIPRNRDVRSQSTPISPLKQSPTSGASPPEIKQQLSAPFYLHSLKDYEAPPFKTIGLEMKPKLLYNTMMNKCEATEMIAALVEKDGLKRFLGYFLVEKNITEKYNLSEKKFLNIFVAETIDYAAQHDFSAGKLACLITIYLSTHLYFKSRFRLTPTALWGYFKETLLCHSIDNFPYGKEVFKPEESYDILTHFHVNYMNNLPLIHILTFGTFRLKLSWPFKKPVRGDDNPARSSVFN